VQLRAARQRSVAKIVLRAGSRFGVAAFFLVGANSALQNAVAEGDTRTISFHHLHTDETITITYKRDGRYDEAALKKLNWFMRDWRRQEETQMDPHLFDLLWEANREVDGKQPIQIVCGFRSPETNAMLRERSTGVAQFSQHTHGQAIDFYIPGVPLAEIRAVGLRMQRGGVGFYPTSGSPFVHLDTGTVRHWPQIARGDLERIFPDGRTVHIPSDGKPLANYKLALLDVEQHGAVPSATSLEAAREAGVITASDEEIAAQQQPKQRSLFARLFGRGKEADDDDSVEQAKPARTLVAASLTPPKLALPKAAAPAKPVVVASAAPVPALAPAMPTVVASLAPLPTPAPVHQAVPLPEARPQIAAAVATAPTREETFATASLGTTWRGSIEKGPELPAAMQVAAAGPAPTALSYAETPMPVPAPSHLRPMGATMPRLPAEATLIPASSASTVMTASTLSGGGANYDSPWLRAAVLTPSFTAYMSSNHAGESFNAQAIVPLLQKPTMSLAMTFSADPNYGMVADRFTGHAVVFLATTTFIQPQALSMR
jgi:uncharacterized protein YcbK (DUF882 family)